MYLLWPHIHIYLFNLQYVFNMILGTYQRIFPKFQFPKGNFISGNLPNVQFPKRQLPKSVLAAALRHHPVLA